MKIQHQRLVRERPFRQVEALQHAQRLSFAPARPGAWRRDAHRLVGAQLVHAGGDDDVAGVRAPRGWSRRPRGTGRSSPRAASPCWSSGRRPTPRSPFARPRASAVSGSRTRLASALPWKRDVGASCRAARRAGRRRRDAHGVGARDRIGAAGDLADRAREAAWRDRPSSDDRDVLPDLEAARAGPRAR